MFYPRFLLRFTALYIAVLAGCMPAYSQSSPSLDANGRWINGVSEPWWFDTGAARGQIEVVMNRWEKVNQEIGAHNDGLYGDYATGDEVHGSYLRWAPKSGYVHLHINKCAARVTGFSYGSVRLTATTLELIPEGEAAGSGAHRHTSGAKKTRFLFVKWQGVPYITLEDQLDDFCNLIAGLGKFNKEFWSGELPYYVKMGSESLGSSLDPPIVPPGYERLIKRPIELKVTAVGRRTVRRNPNSFSDEPQYESHTVVTINGGSAQNVKPGMRFYVVDDGDGDDQVVVRRVGLHSSTAVITRYLEPDKSKHFIKWQEYDRYHPIAVGWRLTTSVRRLFEIKETEKATVGNNQ
jgi:hypothetical protein